MIGYFESLNERYNLNALGIIISRNTDAVVVGLQLDSG
jgi:hypothetical protein